MIVVSGCSNYYQLQVRLNSMKIKPKIFLFLTISTFIVACNAQSSPSEPKPSNEETMATVEESNVDNDANAKKRIVLYMSAHDLWGLEKSTKSDAYYYRVLIEKLPDDKYLVQDFVISGNKLTDPYILTDGQLEYTDNEDVAHPNNYYPREGARTVWFESGNKKIESHYKNNMPSGTWIEYFENGQKKSEDHYKDGVLHGLSKGWNEQGDLTWQCTYNYGVKNGRCYSKFNSYPNIYQSDSNYKNGKKIGISKQWNIDGTIEKISYHDPITMDLLQKSFSDDQFENFVFDVNADSIQDVVVTRINDSSNIYQGNELYIYLGDANNEYELSLDTSNFTSDGGYHLYNIIARNNDSGLIIATSFPDRGSSFRDYYIVYRDDQWLLDKVSYHGDINNSAMQSYNCDVNQDINLADDDYDIETGFVGSSDEVLKRKCPPLPSKYKVKAKRAEILNEKFESRSPPNYYIKGDTIEAFDQNKDWVKVSYKNGTKFGWIDKRDLSPVSD